MNHKDSGSRNRCIQPLVYDQLNFIGHGTVSVRVTYRAGGELTLPFCSLVTMH
jgi:hypothetical protein